MKITKKILSIYRTIYLKLTISCYNNLKDETALGDAKVAKLTAQDIADYFLSLVDEDCGDTISNLKLQKLVYYAQGFCLALTGNTLFDEPILAWQHGPVIRSLWDKYNAYGASPIPRPTVFDLNKFDAFTKELLDDVWEVYGQFSAWKLRNLTHDEKPWLDTVQNQIILPELMEAYFKTQLS